MLFRSQQPEITSEAANIFLPIAKTINAKFSDDLYSKTIVEDIIDYLIKQRKIHVTEANVKDIVYNRQLVLEKFS